MLLALLVASTAARTNWAAWSFIIAVNSFACMICVCSYVRHVCRLSQVGGVNDNNVSSFLQGQRYEV